MLLILKKRLRMKKIFLFLIMIIVLGLSVVYMFLFTKFGNDKMASYIENKVNSGQQEVKLKDSQLIDLKKQLDVMNDISVKQSSTLNYVIKNFQDAPPICSIPALTMEDVLGIDTDKNFENNIMFRFSSRKNK